jgi:hypothetical protein
MKRIQNWRAPLMAEFLAGRSRTFAWGTFDCALFACDCVKAQTGHDPAAGFRGRYKTQAEAEALGSLSQIVSQTAANSGLAEILPAEARRGDLVLVVNGASSQALAVIDFSGMYAVCPGGRGLIRVRRHRWKRAWRV